MDVGSRRLPQQSKRSEVSMGIFIVAKTERKHVVAGRVASGVVRRASKNESLLSERVRIKRCGTRESLLQRQSDGST